MKRLPSIGLLWLAATFAAAGAGYWWLQRPFWFEQPEPQAREGKCHYWLRLAARGDGSVRQACLAVSLDIAVSAGRQDGDWDLLLTVLERMHAGGLALGAWSRVLPGRAWLLGAGTDRRGRPGQPIGVLLHNPSGVPIDVELAWSAAAGVKATVAASGKEPVPLAFAGGTARHVVSLGAHVGTMVDIQTIAPEKLRLLAVVGLD